MKHKFFPDPNVQVDNLLRQKPDERLKKKSTKSSTVHTDVDAMKLLHELEVHQTELEMQNIQLRLALEAAATAISLFDFAPVGYFVLNYDGTICMLNFKGANMLGKERLHLINSNLRMFITKESLPIFNDFLKIIRETNSKHTCEIRLTIDKNPSCYVQIESSLSKDKEKCLLIVFDITERKQIENKLLESEAKFKNIYENDPMGMALVGIDLNFIDTNSTFCKMMGYTEQELKCFTFKDITHPDYIADDLANMIKLIEGKIPLYKTEKRYIRKDKQVIWGSLTVSVQYADGGKIRYLLALLENINDRKLVEEELKKSQLKYRMVADNTYDWQSWRDADGKYLYQSPSCKRITGYNPEDLINNPEILLKLIHPEEIDAYLRHTQIAATLMDPATIEFRIITADGQTKWIDHVCQPVFDAIGNFLGTRGSNRDITEHKRIEQELRESEQKYHNIFEESFDGLFITSAQGKILGMNKKGISMLGYENVQEIINLDLVKDIYANPLDNKWIIEMVNNKGAAEFEVEVKKKYGEKMVTHCSLTAVKGETDVITSYRGIIRDITDHKKVEEALQESEAHLRELNTTKDKFFSIIAHDLKSPFNSIIGFSDLLVDQVQEKDYDGIENYAMIVQKSSKQAMSLLSNLMEWSSLQTGRMEFTPENIDIIELINEVIQLLNFSAQQKSITISCKNKNKINIFADKAMINTVLRNLITNAIKFTNTDGNIVVSTEQKHDELIISVRDDGIGINKETIEKLFRIDQKHSTIGTNNEVGTGLGLILCKEFIEKHSGRIWVESIEGKGSKFCFTIPKFGRFIGIHPN